MMENDVSPERQRPLGFWAAPWACAAMSALWERQDAALQKIRQERQI